MLRDQLLGTWSFTMRHVLVAEDVTGQQHGAPALDGAFVLLRTTYDRPDFPDALALLDERRSHYFDTRGVVRVFDVVWRAGGWTTTWLDEGFSQRTDCRVRSADVVDVVGERSDDLGATWVPDFTITLTRRQAGA